MPYVPRDFNEQVKRYLEKSGDTRLELRKRKLHKRSSGFCVWYHTKGAMVITALYVEDERDYWDQWIKFKAKEIGAKEIIMFTKRNPKAWERSHGFKLEGYFLKRPV